MAIAYRSGSTGGNSSGTDVTVTKPSGVADNDILVAILYREAGTWTLPSGWAWLGDEVAGYNGNLWNRVAWKRASGEGASWVFQLSVSSWRVISCAAFSGAATSGTPFDTQVGNAPNSTTVSGSSVTTSYDNAYVIVAIGNCTGENVAVASSGMTQGPELGGTEIFYVAQASSGASGTKTFNTVSVSGSWSAITTALWASTSSASISPSSSVSSSTSRSTSPSVSPSTSPSVSPSSSISPSNAAYTSGTTAWGHVTGVIETNVRTFAGNWTGTGEIQNSGDSERIALNSGEYMESEVINTGSVTVTLLQNNYSAGDTVILKYRQGATDTACTSASWITYTVPFASSGYAQVRIEATI